MMGCLLTDPISAVFLSWLLYTAFDRKGTMQEVLSYAMYPKVFEDYLTSLKKDGNFRYMGSDIFFHGCLLYTSRCV